ncbi:MAG: hypothetical protein JWL70_2329 [Acidimicrobiia bacterium]|nr:hypothetical protein [Acidimicrobiia bacterium]
MTTYALRLWIPDRPGALGQVASRIGSVGGDVIGIEILERGAGQAIDELLILLPDPNRLDLLVAEVTQVDGVAIEDVRPATPLVDDALTAAALLVEAKSRQMMFEVFCAETALALRADWTVILDRETVRAEASVGDAPTAGWLHAFVEGIRHAGVAVGPDDVAWAELPGVPHDIVVGRQGRPLRARERSQLELLARIAGARAQDLGVVEQLSRPA